MVADEMLTINHHGVIKFGTRVQGLSAHLDLGRERLNSFCLTLKLCHH